MDYYAQLCSALFQAVSKSGHFKDLRVYYFHNCVYGRLYNDPMLMSRNSVTTDWVLSNISTDWKVIFVGDAQMAPYELGSSYNDWGQSNQAKSRSGMDWLKLIRNRYPHTVWLNPSERPVWGEYWTRTYDQIAGVFPMFPLTVDGLEESMKKLLSRS